MSGCGGVGVSQERVTSRGLLISWGPERRGGEPGSDGGRPVTSLIRNFASAGLAGKRTGQHPVRPQGSGEENEAHGEG
jgi:hypothetical protein